MCKAAMCLVLASVVFSASPVRGQSSWDDVLTWGYRRDSGQRGEVRGRIKSVDKYHAVIQREGDSQTVRIPFRDLAPDARLLLCRYLADQLGAKDNLGPTPPNARRKIPGNTMVRSQ